MPKIIPIPDEIVTDEQIKAVHAYANFGSMTKRSVVNDGVLKYYLGYLCGHTQIQILSEHGLIRTRRNASYHSYDRVLTQKGRAYLKAMLKEASFSGLMKAITKKDES
jgi:hypothetical protein